MEIEDYKEVIANYQQKCFELLNENIVLKSQVNVQNKKIEELRSKLNQKLNTSEGFS